MARPRRSWLWWLAFALLLPFAALGVAWVALALHFQSSPAPLWITLWLAVAVAALLLVLLRRTGTGLGVVLGFVVPFAIWWTSIHPTNDRAWQPEVAGLLSGVTDSANPDRVTLTNVRDFHWLTPTTADPRWETRSYDLAELQTTDIILTYWMGPAIAHTMVTFGFADGEHIVFSVGIRPAEGQVFSSVAGFFKVFELIVTAADERDAIGLRASVQTGNTVHLYRLAVPPAIARELFLEYAALANSMVEEPRFYRTIVANCTTIIWSLVRRLDSRLPLDWRVLVSGYLPGYLYDLRTLDMRFTLPELEAMSILPTDVPLTLDSRAYAAALRAQIPPLEAVAPRPVGE